MLEARGNPDDEAERAGPAPTSGPDGRQSPRRMAPSRSRRAPETRMPVSLETISDSAARQLLADALDLAAKIERTPDAFTMSKLAGAIVNGTLAGDAAVGLRVGTVCSYARVGRGHLDEHFTVGWRDLAALGVHSVYAGSRRRVLYEEIRSLPERVGRRHHGLGSDHHPGCPRTRFLLVRSLSASDRHCPVSAIPLTTATRWDSTGELGRSEPARPAWSGEPLEWPQTLDEHVDSLVEDATRLRRAYNAAAADPAAAVLGGADQRALLTTFSNRFVMPPLPCGTPSDARREQAEIRHPGLDPAVIAVFERRKIDAVLACGIGGAVALPMPGAGFEPLRIDGPNGPEPVQITHLPQAAELGITSTWGVEHFHSPADRRIARRVTTPAGVRTEIWQLVGFNDDLPAAVALIERQAQCSWMGQCLQRFIGDCAPGKLKAHAPRSVAGLLALMILANAAIVDADRRAQVAVEFT